MQIILVIVSAFLPTIRFFLRTTIVPPLHPRIEQKRRERKKDWKHNIYANSN